MKNSYSFGVICCLLATLSWGGTFPLMTTALQHIDPYLFTTLRYGFAGIFLAITLYIKEGKKGFKLKGERFFLAWFLGSLAFVGFGFLVFLGQQMAGASGALTASIMMATMPMLGILVNWKLRHIVPPKISILLIFISFFGVITVITQGDYLSLISAQSHYKANFLIILGAFCWVIYTIGASYFSHWSPLKYTTLTTCLGMSSVLVLNSIIYYFNYIQPPSLDNIILVIPQVAYTAIFASFFGILCWNIGNKILSPMNGVLFMDVVPLTAFSISAIMGVVPNSAEIFGACITGLALILNNLYLRYKK